MTTIPSPLLGPHNFLATRRHVATYLVVLSSWLCLCSEARLSFPTLQRRHLTVEPEDQRYQQLQVISSKLATLSEQNIALKVLGAAYDKPRKKFAEGCMPLNKVPKWPCLNDTFKICPSNITVVSTGSIRRPEVQDMQLQTLGKHFFILTTNESLYPVCYICNGVRRLKRPEQLFKIWWRYDYKSLDWYCAQQRFIMGLADTMLVMRQALPDWLVMVDDDTSVNPIALAELLASLNSSQSLYVGHRNPGKVHYVREFALGGAGYALSRGLMQELLAPVLSHTMYKLNQNQWKEESESHKSVIEECKQQVFDGALCYSHSDWVVADCIHAATGHRLMDNEAHDWRFSQKNCTSTDTRHITCHYMLASDQLARYKYIQTTTCAKAKQQQQQPKT